MPSPLTLDDVERIAALARLALTDEERSLLATQLAEILSYARQIQQVDTSGVPPTSHAFDAQRALRPDTTSPSLDRDQTLANAPDPAAGPGLFKVPRVIG